MREREGECRGQEKGAWYFDAAVAYVSTGGLKGDEGERERERGRGRERETERGGGGRK